MYKAEMTDTFAGEANYCWVKRADLPTTKTLRGAVRLAKKAFGMENVRCNSTNYGDVIRLDVRGACIVIFVRWED